MSFQIPLGSEGSQKLTTVLDGTTYNLKISYNSRMGVWTCDLENSFDSLKGLGLLLGVDVIRQFALEIKNLYIVNLSNTNEDANSENLGEEVIMVKLTDNEVQEIVSSI